MVAVLIALLLQATYYLVRIRFASWVRPTDAVRGVRDALVMAFSTASSTATMPLTYDCLREKVGLRRWSAIGVGMIAQPREALRTPSRHGRPARDRESRRDSG